MVSCETIINYVILRNLYSQQLHHNIAAFFFSEAATGGVL